MRERTEEYIRNKYNAKIIEKEDSFFIQTTYKKDTFDIGLILLREEIRFCYEPGGFKLRKSEFKEFSKEMEQERFLDEG